MISIYYMLFRRGITGGGGPGTTLSTAYKTRVEADGGSIEGFNCLRDNLNTLSL
jgi:hypothetical protein